MTKDIYGDQHPYEWYLSHGGRPNPGTAALMAEVQRGRERSAARKAALSDPDDPTTPCEALACPSPIALTDRARRDPVLVVAIVSSIATVVTAVVSGVVATTGGQTTGREALVILATGLLSLLVIGVTTVRQNPK